MIQIEQINKDQYQLTESILGFTETKRRRWYYDLDRGLISEKPDFPDSMITRKLTARQKQDFLRRLELSKKRRS